MQRSRVILCAIVLYGFFFKAAFGFDSTFFCRRMKDINYQNGFVFSVFSANSTAIVPVWKCFPDGEINVALDNWQDISGEDITVGFSPHERRDFLEAIFLVAAIKEYNPRNIKVEVKNWQAQNSYEEAMLYALSIFADEIEGAGIDTSFKPKSGSETISEFSRVLHFNPKLRDIAQKLGEEFNAQISEIGIEDKDLHWSLENLPSVEGEDLLIVASTESVSSILDLVSLLYALRKEGVRSITLANTYQGYARQDKIFQEGEGVSGYAVLKTLNSFLDYNFVINVHYGDRSGLVTFTGRGDEEVFNINAFPQLAEALYSYARESKGVDGKTILLLAPDDGSFTYVREAEAALLEYVSQAGDNVRVISGYLNKVRLDASTVAFSGPILTSDGELTALPQDTIVFLLDDETSTGMTVKIGMHYLVNVLTEYNLNPGDIYAGIVHGKFVNGISDYLSRGSNYMPPVYTLCMDTIALPEDFQALSVVDLFKKALHDILFANISPAVQSIP